MQAALATTYTIERELGRGGMATVYLAHDLRHDRPVALKVLHADLAQTLGPERFQREIKLAARLQHPHILSVHDSGAAGQLLWFTMPFVEGESLRDRLRREKQLPVDAAVRITTEAARALDYAHRHGVVHRDIKPENLLLTADGSTLVADFGIARAVGGGDDRLTQTGFAIGTPAYMSPEQAAGDRGVDARTDIYSLGAVLYEMLAGEPPFTGATAQAVIAKRLTGDVPRVRHVRPSVPESVEQAVSRALAPVAADRFESVADFARALAFTPAASAPATPTADTPVTSAAPTVAAPAARAPRRIPVGLVTLVLGFLLGLGVLFAWRRSHRSEAPTGTRVVAVLPFENLGSPDEEYFADGITDEVRGKLSALPGLRVIAGGSSKEYKRSDKPLTQIGRELGADYLLVAKVRWAKDASGASRVRVSPELVEVADATPTTRWQQPFDASLTDVFQVQADIAGRVAGALQVALGDSVQKTIESRPTSNLAAYDAFLRGEAATGSMVRIDVNSLRQGAAHYEQATALDPEFALAWAQLARARALLYGNSTPSRALAEQVRQATDRAKALAPNSPATYLALASYDNAIGKGNNSIELYQTGLRLAPDNVELLSTLALAEVSAGRWDSAMVHLQRAAELDPRSVRTFRRLGYVLRRLRRYDESQVALDRALSLAPTELSLIEHRAMVDLARGNLAAARAVIRAVPREVDPTALVAYLANYWDLYWVLDEDQIRLLLRLSPTAFDEDRASWGLAIAQTLWMRGERDKARAYADSARVVFEAQLKETPEDAQRNVLSGVALAILGRKAEAIRQGQKGVSLEQDAFNVTYFRHVLARIYVMVGEQDKAIDEIEGLLGVPYDLSKAWLRIDPNFAPLKGNSRFDRLIAQ